MIFHYKNSSLCIYPQGGTTFCVAQVLKQEETKTSKTMDGEKRLNLQPSKPMNLGQSVCTFVDNFRAKFAKGEELQNTIKNAWQSAEFHATENMAKILSIAKPPKNGNSVPGFASLSQSESQPNVVSIPDVDKEVSKRLDGIPVYTVSNGNSEVSFVSDVNNHKDVAFFFFRKTDANSFLSQFASEDSMLNKDAKVISVPLNKVYELEKEGITFRFLPDPNQVKNALEVSSKGGNDEKYFPGVPVFQCDYLTFRSVDKRFHPCFFSKEDLESSLGQAVERKKQLNQTAIEVNKATDIQVGSFEDILSKMKASDSSAWKNIVFIPPGFDALNRVDSSNIP